MTQAPSLTQGLADLLTRPISKKDRDRAALLLLDWTGCAIAGQTEPAGQKVTAAFPNETGGSTRIGTSKASPQMAALHNGCLGNVLEMDDVDKRAVLHAAPTVIPAALAMAEYVNASHEELLKAMVVGYEATIRIGRAVGAGHYAYWHNTATCGPFGAAASACYLLEESNLVSAFGLAGTQAAGLWQTRHEPDSMAKQLHAGHAAQVGVQSALLSAQGFKGPKTILEGEQGFFKAMCPGGYPKDILINYGEEWLIHQTSIKPYPACRHAHAAIDAAKLVKEWDGTSKVIIETYSDAIKFCNKPKPQTTIEAKFSLQHSVALILAQQNLTLDMFSLKSVNNPEISAIRDLVEIRESEIFTGQYPAHYGAAIIIGDTRYTVKDAYGDPERPLSKEAVIEKAITLMKYADMDESISTTLSQATLEGDISRYLDLLP